MQKKWVLDPDKLTFIILDRQKFLESNGNEIESMIGDTNLFLINSDQNTESEFELQSKSELEIESKSESKSELESELEIMIAEPTARRKGLASESLKLLILFAIREKISPNGKFSAKIGAENLASCRLFENLGFVRIGLNEIFHEVHYFFHLNDEKVFNQFMNETKYELVQINK